MWFSHLQKKVKHLEIFSAFLSLFELTAKAKNPTNNEMFADCDRQWEWMQDMQDGPKEKKKGKSVKKKKLLKEDAACYILITCGQPGADGKLSVEMTYEGDPSLASYLLESAQGFIDQEEEGFSH